MTIAKTGNKVQYDGDGGTLPFTYAFRFFDDTDLEVILLDASNVETVQVLTTDYTVSNTGTEAGGTVTMIVAPAIGEKLTILADIPETQGADYTGNDPFPAETHETALDRLTRLQQQTSEISMRSLRVTASDTASLEIPIDRADTFLAFDASKNPIAIAGVVSEVPVSTFMATVLDDETAAAARTTLGAASTAQGAKADSALQNVSEDTTPEAGGDFSMNGNVFSESIGTPITAAANLTLAGDGNFYQVNGNTGINGIDNIGGATAVELFFNGTPLLTHHATDFRLPGGNNIQVNTGDRAWFRQIATDQFRLSFFQRTDGTALVASASGLTLLATIDFSSDATGDFTAFDETKYDSYMFSIQNVTPVTDNVTLFMRTSSNGGSSYDLGATDYAHNKLFVSSTGSVTGSSSLSTEFVIGGTTGSAAGEDGVSGEINLYSPHLSKETFITYAVAATNQASALVHSAGSGQRRASAVVDAVRFQFSSGNLESGTITMYGKANS